MKKLLVAGALALGAAACAPEINKDPNPEFGPTANFDPAAVPPVVPSPNELAISQTTGKNAVAVPAGAPPVNQAFADYLGTLDGFPAGSSASATFSAPLDPASVQGSVKVIDLSNGADVTDTVTVAYAEPPAAPAPRVTVVPPASGWKVNNRYGVVFTNGLKGTDGKTVEPSATMVFVRSGSSLVTCPGDNLQSPECRPTTELIPSTETDPAARAADVRAKALRLEGLRRLYSPVIDASGVAREDVVLAWTFKTASNPTVAFDPSFSRIPTPTDLVMTGLGTANQKVAIPVTKTADGGYASANDEFNDTYLNTLDGFPVSSTATAPVVGGVKLNAATVTPATVAVLRIDVASPTPCNSSAGIVCPVSAGVGAGDTTSGIEVRRNGGWPKGSRWAVAVTKGVRDTAGNSVEPSTVTWQLVRSTSPIATCENLATATGCTVNFQVSALTVAEAVRLETLRQSYAPLFAGLEAAGIQRNNVAVLWTFTVTSQSEVVFDPNPADPAIPFPVTIPNVTATLQPDGGMRVALPVTGTATEQALITGLNSLDGFSTTAPIVTEGDADRGVLDTGAIATDSLDGGVGLLKVKSVNGTARTNTAPNVSVAYVPEGTGGTLLDGGVKPATLAIVPNTPLDERTLYVAMTRTSVQATNTVGTPSRTVTKPVVPAGAFALLRLKNPLVANGKSTVSAASDAQAQALEPLRQYFAQTVFAAIDAANIPRTSVAHAFPFHTQSTVSQLPAVANYPVDANLPTGVGYLANISTQVAAGNGGSLPPGVGQVIQGTYVTANLLTGPGGTLNPTGPRLERIPFWLVLPAAAPQGAGYDLTVFGHGLTRNKSDVLAIASSLTAANRAVLAIDWVTHGDRSVCTADADCAAGGTCSLPTTGGAPNYASPTFGRCVSATQPACTAQDEALTCAAVGAGRCLFNPDPTAASTCEGSRATAAASGKAMFSVASPFGTRDNFRQHLVDLTQLLRVVSATDFTAAVNTAAGRTDVVLNTTRHDYVGQSLGGILGTTWTAANGTRRAVLNVPGADLPTVVLEAPGFASLRPSFLAALPPVGTPEFDRTVNIFRWILDPIDPANAAYWLENRVGVSGAVPANPEGRAALIQYITDDQTVPNKNNILVARAANRPGAESQTAIACWNPSEGDLPLANRHGFLLNGFSASSSGPANQAITLAAQTQAVTFLATGNETEPSEAGTCPAGFPQ